MYDLGSKLEGRDGDFRCRCFIFNVGYGSTDGAACCDRWCSSELVITVAHVLVLWFWFTTVLEQINAQERSGDHPVVVGLKLWPDLNVFLN